ncbi:NusA-like transcription termination signal-binding factor [Candidatus Woesearchaeota archaeon]|nr:NusA-like transcription termination signal-binding factor [Candidatus Woesearchaeota archaeon]
MTRIKYDMNLMKYMELFETLTRAKLKDCFIDKLERVVFVVMPNNIGKAIGKKGINIKKIEDLLKKKIRIVEFDPEMNKFISNLVFPLKITGFRFEGGILTINGADTNTKGLLIGRNAQNLRNTESIVKRFFELEEIKVI